MNKEEYDTVIIKVIELQNSGKTIMYEGRQVIIRLDPDDKNKAIIHAWEAGIFETYDTVKGLELKRFKNRFQEVTQLF